MEKGLWGDNPKVRPNEPQSPFCFIVKHTGSDQIGLNVHTLLSRPQSLHADHRIQKTQVRKGNSLPQADPRATKKQVIAESHLPSGWLWGELITLPTRDPNSQQSSGLNSTHVFE